MADRSVLPPPAPGVPLADPPVTSVEVKEEFEVLTAAEAAAAEVGALVATAVAAPTPTEEVEAEYGAWAAAAAEALNGECLAE